MHFRILFLLAVVPTFATTQYSWVNFIYHHNVNCLLADGPNLWIGTTDAGLIFRDNKTEKEIVFDSDNGFIGDQIIGIAKGADNTIWTATSKMIASYKNDRWSTHDLFGNKIVSFTADNNGSIWVACEKSLFKQAGDKFKLVNGFDSLRLANEYPHSITTGTNDNCIYMQAGTRIFCFNLDGTCRSIINIPLSNPFNIAVDKANRLFVTNIDTVGLYTNGTWTFFTTKDKSLPCSVSKLTVSPQGNVWAYGVTNVLIFNNVNWVTWYKHELGVNLITTLAPINNDSAWVGGSFLGYLSFDSLRIINSNAPGNNNVKFIYADKQGTIWVQTMGDNIIQYNNTIWDYNNSIFGTLGVKTERMIHLTNGSYCFLQPRDIMFYKSKINGVIQNYIVGSGFIPSGELNDLTEDNAGDLWFATTKGVIKNWSTTYFDTNNTEFTSNNIKVLLLRKDSTLWAGGNCGTLAYFKDNSWISQNLSRNYYITCLAEDTSRGLWVGTTEGLFNISDGKKTLYTISNGLGNNNINSLLIDKNNRVWAGTYSGLSYFENNCWTTLKRPCGIAGDFISSIVQNNDGTLWIGTDRGVSTLQIASSKIKNLHTQKMDSFQKPVNKIIPFNKKTSFNQNEYSYYLINGTRLMPHQISIDKNRAATIYIAKQSRQNHLLNKKK